MNPSIKEKRVCIVAEVGLTLLEILQVGLNLYLNNCSTFICWSTSFTHLLLE